MAIDAICLQAVVEELRPQLSGLRVDKVQQPARDQVILLFRGKRLLLNAGAGAPRLQLTDILRDNPAEPPMFCMLLRKHLSGARVADIVQPPLERLVHIEFDAADELGRTGRRTLVLEAMGRRSNLILLDGEGRVIDSLRRVDADMSAARQVLPGLPPPQAAFPFWRRRRRALPPASPPRRRRRPWTPSCWTSTSASPPSWPGSLPSGRRGTRIPGSFSWAAPSPSGGQWRTSPAGSGKTASPPSA